MRGNTLRRAVGIGCPSTSASPEVGQHQAQQHPHRGGLAGTVRAEKAIHIAGADLQVNAVHRSQLAISLGQRPSPDDVPVGRERRSSLPLQQLDRCLAAASRTSQCRPAERRRHVRDTA